MARGSGLNASGNSLLFGSKRAAKLTAQRQAKDLTKSDWLEIGAKQYNWLISEEIQRFHFAAIGLTSRHQTAFDKNLENLAPLMTIEADLGNNQRSYFGIGVVMQDAFGYARDDVKNFYPAGSLVKFFLGQTNQMNSEIEVSPARDFDAAAQSVLDEYRDLGEYRGSDQDPVGFSDAITKPEDVKALLLSQAKIQGIY